MQHKTKIDRKIVRAIKKGEYYYPEHADIWVTPEGKIARQELEKQGKFWSYKPTTKPMKTKTYKKTHRLKKAADGHAKRIKARGGKVKRSGNTLAYSF